MPHLGLIYFTQRTSGETQNVLDMLQLFAL